MDIWFRRKIGSLAVRDAQDATSESRLKEPDASEGRFSEAMALARLMLSPDLFPLHVVIVFVFGALMGSFFNVCIYRLPLGQSVNRPRRSFCPWCGTMIEWYDNIPLISYVALGGVCRHCGSPISMRYWVVELLTALLFTAVFVTHGYKIATLFFFVLTGVLIISTFTDLDHWIIPDSVSVGGLAIGIAGALGVSALQAAATLRETGLENYVSYPFGRWGAWALVVNSLSGAVFGFVLLWAVGVLGALAFRKEAMGMGDMKLFACIGAFLGWQGCLMVLVLASFIGATFGLSLIAAQWIVARVCPAASSIEDRPCTSVSVELKQPVSPDIDTSTESSSTVVGSGASGRAKSRRLHHLPFGPYIAAAAYLVALFYQPMIEWLTRHFFLLDLYGRYQ